VSEACGTSGKEELWLTVGLFDLSKRYRRSSFSPLWITISLGTFILGLSFIYRPLVGGDARLRAEIVGGGAAEIGTREVNLKALIMKAQGLDQAVAG
jgi:hypothetical protein